MFQLLLSDKYVTVSEWQGTTRVHIQTYFSSNGNAPGGGELIPTKKEIAFNIDEWNALKNYVDLVDAGIAKCEDEHILGKANSNVPYAPLPNTPQQFTYVPNDCSSNPFSVPTYTTPQSHTRRVQGKANWPNIVKTTTENLTHSTQFKM